MSEQPLTKAELDNKVKELVQSSANAQSFADLLSIDDNWNQVDKKISLPRTVAFFEGDCPSCQKTIRTLHEKFCTADSRYSMTCPHCKERISCLLQFDGYTCSLHFEEYEETTQ